MNSASKNRKEMLKGDRGKVQTLTKNEGKNCIWQEAVSISPHPHALFSKSSRSEIIVLHHNWGTKSGSWYKWSWVQFGEISYTQLPPINSRGSEFPDLLLGILWKQLLFTALPLKDEIHKQGLTSQKITVYVSTYLPSAAKNLVSSAPGIWLQLPASGCLGILVKKSESKQWDWAAWKGWTGSQWKPSGRWASSQAL